MKNKTFFTALLMSFFLVSFTNSFAQINPQTLANDELRAIFGNLNLPPTNTKDFLYDMSAHVVDEVFFGHMCPELSNTDNWFLLYEEMYYAAYDTSLWTTVGDVFEDVYMTDKNGRVPIGIMDFDYYRLKSDALTTDIYFDFDIVNNTITDRPGRLDYPYDTRNVFAAAPLVQSSLFSDVIFSISPNVYHDSYNSQYYAPGNNYTVKINFDDGNGWVTFTPPLDHEHTVNYTVMGDKEIEVAVFDDGMMIKYSKSLFKVGSTHTSPVADMVINSVPGLKADVYFNCQNTSQQLNKVLIYVEGYEILDFLKVLPFYKSTKSAEDYVEMLEQPQVVQLQNFGYDIVMVDFGSTGNAIHDNAMSLIGLIDQLKCLTMNDHQFVILGHSMGGVISRYALSHMEQFPPGPNSCEPAKGHNTRLLITNDSPHQGANIPLSIQHLYRIGFNALPGQSIINRKLAELFNVMLDSKGVKDMLIYHVDTRNSIGEYTHHSRRATLLNDLNNLANGGYPEHCKLMALSDGSMGGKAQTKISDGSFRNPNDTLLNMSASVYLRILGIKTMGTDADFTLRTNPDMVTGDLLKASVDAWKVKIRFFFFGVTLDKTVYSLYNHNITATNIPSFCTSAGGIYKFNLIKGDPYNNSYSLPPFGLFKYNGSGSGTGNMDFEFSIGIPWLANANMNFSITSDGLYWSFIPVASALDYTPGPFGMDIEKEGPHKYTTAASKFDIIAGVPTAWAFQAPNDGAIYNRHHRFLRNEGVTSHPTCPDLDGEANYVRLLNQEIGENRLYLNNMNLDRTGMYEAQQDIYVNYQNPYYSGLFRSLYSKDDCFEVSGSGNAIFKFDSSISPPPGTGIYFNTSSCSIPTPNTQLDQQQLICCIDYTKAREDIKPIEETEPVASLAVSIFPNPVKLGDFSITMDWVRGTQADVQMTNVTGKTIFTESITDLTPNETVTFKVNTMAVGSLASGIYFLSVSDGEEKVVERIMILN